MNTKQFVLIGLVLLSLVMLAPARAANLSTQTINGIQKNIKLATPDNAAIKKTSPLSAAQIRGVSQQAGVIRPAAKAPPKTGFATSALSAPKLPVQPRSVPGTGQHTLLKEQKGPTSTSAIKQPLPVAGASKRKHSVTPVNNAFGQIGHTAKPVFNSVPPVQAEKNIHSAIAARMKHSPGIRLPGQGVSALGKGFVGIPLHNSPMPDVHLPVSANQPATNAPVEKGVSNPKQHKPMLVRELAFYHALPVNKIVREKLMKGKTTRYAVLTRRPSRGNASFARHAWKGKIILPNLARKAKPVRIMIKGKKGGVGTRTAQWLLKNPDGSFSKQIKDVNGRLAGNVTFTRDGSVRIGLDLTGNQEADLYEMISSDGEHSLLASPVGQAALDHFMNGGKNPLCNPGITGANPTGGGFAGGMISGEDKTAMQVACGRKEHKPGSGGSGSGGISGDPGGRATDAMCKDVLSRHRDRPGNPGMVQSNPAGTGDNPHWNPPPSSITDEEVESVVLKIVRDVGTIIRLIRGNALMLDTSPDALFPDSPPSSADPIPDQQNDPDAAMLTYCQRRENDQMIRDARTMDTRYVRQLCANPASQPSPVGNAGSAGNASSTTIGDTYGSSITLATYCGQHGGQGTPAPSPEGLIKHAGGGRNCGSTQSPGADGQCHGVGTQFNGGSTGRVNVSYGAVIGIPVFDERVTNPSDPR